jgi:hypothetical protein
MDALLISPKYTSRDWQALNVKTPEDWPKAAEMVRDRLEGRFLRFASECLESPYSGFVVLAIDTLLAEAIQQFAEGITDGQGKSEKMIKGFLRGGRFQPDFDGPARGGFYSDIRCGLLHQAEAKGMWLIRRNQSALLQKNGNGYIIDVKLFHAAVRDSLDDYLQMLVDPAKSTLRENLWTKMNHICRVRDARGAVYEAEEDGVTVAEEKKMCPECGHQFAGNGWDGIDAHWKANHEKVMPYKEAWPLIKAGTYKRPVK